MSNEVQLKCPSCGEVFVIDDKDLMYLMTTAKEQAAKNVRFVTTGDIDCPECNTSPLLTDWIGNSLELN